MKNKNLNIKDKQLGFYLAGLIEGDGNFWIPKSITSSTGHTYSPQIAFSFNIVDMPLFEQLKQKNFKTGGLYTEKPKRAGVYRISEVNTLIEIINLINGKFRTPKVKQLYKMIDRVNTLYNTEIKKLPLDNSPLTSNAWLAGFTDADGSFHIGLTGVYSLNESLARGDVRCTFSITQRRTYKLTGDSCIPFMLKIAEIFQCKLYLDDVRNCIDMRVQANRKNHLVKSYFEGFPLMTSKYLNYMCFVQGFDYLATRLSDKEILEVQAIKNSMNNKRTYYNWDHLLKFYN